MKFNTNTSVCDGFRFRSHLNRRQIAGNEKQQWQDESDFRLTELWLVSGSVWQGEDRRTAHKVKDRETDINQMIRVFIKLLAYHKHIQTKRSTHRHTTMYNTNIVAVLDKSCCIFLAAMCVA